MKPKLNVKILIGHRILRTFYEQMIMKSVFASTLIETKFTSYIKTIILIGKTETIIKLCIKLCYCPLYFSVQIWNVEILFYNETDYFIIISIIQLWMDTEELVNNQCNTFTALEIIHYFFLTMTMEQTRKMTFAKLCDPKLKIFPKIVILCIFRALGDMVFEII